MRVRVLTLSLALVLGAHAIGCKSAPKLPWFSTADKAAAGASTATTASTAPQLPSEIAKQTEGLASADPVKITTAPAAQATGGNAPAYVAGATPSAYPSTGAQDYLSSSAAALKSAANATATNTAAAAKSTLPYDPTAVPPSSSATADAASTLASTADRYGMPSQDRYADAYPTTTPSYSPASIPSNTTQAVTNSLAAPTTSSVPYASQPISTSLGDRYATQSVPTTSPVNTTVPDYSAPVQTASAVASVQLYRPGGTSSYPGTSASYEVAVRPDATTSSTPGETLYR